MLSIVVVGIVLSGGKGVFKRSVVGLEHETIHVVAVGVLIEHEVSE